MHFGVTFEHLLMNTVTDSGQGLLHFSRGAQSLSESAGWLNAVKLPLLREHPYQRGKTANEKQQPLNTWEENSETCGTLICKGGGDIPLPP